LTTFRIISWNRSLQLVLAAFPGLLSRWVVDRSSLRAVLSLVVAGAHLQVVDVGLTTTF
jgi:hypothetical protein